MLNITLCRQFVSLQGKLFPPPACIEDQISSDLPMKSARCPAETIQGTQTLSPHCFQMLSLKKETQYGFIIGTKSSWSQPPRYSASKENTSTTSPFSTEP